MEYSSLPVTIGNYELLEVIGKSGTGEVYRACHVHLDVIRAIKIISPEVFGALNIQECLKQKARIQAQLKHENVVEVFEFFEFDSKFCIVMEYIEGESLDKLIKYSFIDRENAGESRTSAEKSAFGLRLTQEKAIDISIKCLDALYSYHSHGIIHRNIKPSNILVGIDGLGYLKVKITDFGITKLVKEKAGSTGQLTNINDISGSLEYMAPELIDPDTFGNCDYRADLYSLGVTLYEMLCGRFPSVSSGVSSSKIMEHYVYEEPLSLQGINPDVSIDLESIVLKAISKRPKDRYQSALEFRSCLENLKGNPSDAKEADTTPIDTREIIGKTLRKNPKNKKYATILVSIAFFFIITGAGLYFYFLQAPDLKLIKPKLPIKLELAPNENKTLFLEYNLPLEKAEVKSVDGDGCKTIKVNVNQRQAIVNIIAAKQRGISKVTVQIYPEEGKSTEYSLNIMTKHALPPPKLKLISPKIPVKWQENCHRIVRHVLEYNLPLKRVKLISTHGNGHVGRIKVSINPDNAQQAIIDLQTVKGNGVSSFWIQVFPRASLVEPRKDYIDLIVSCYFE